MVTQTDLSYTSKSVLQGYLVTLIGIWIPIFLVISIPGVYGILAWLGYLVLFLLVSTGKLGWTSTKPERKLRTRRNTSTPQLMGLGLALAALFVVIGQSVLMVTFRFIEFPYDLFVANTNYSVLTPFETWVTILLGAIGAGVYEEIGFRGYMQVPLENKYGFMKTNLLVSVMFMLLHLNQLWAPALLIQLVLLSLLWGVLAYVTGSLIPGIISHVVLDIFNFGFWWSDFFGVYTNKPIFETGTDRHFWVWSVVMIVSTVLFLYLARLTFAIKNKSLSLSVKSTSSHPIPE